MKKILIQLDTDKHPSTFDRIVAYDAGADEVLSYGGVTPGDVRGLVLSAVFTRGVPDLKTIAVWVGGFNVVMGEQILAEVQRSFFGPFRVSVMLDSNGCNTTAATAIAKLGKAYDLKGRKAVVVGLGPVGLRSALLLQQEGCSVTVTSIPPDLLGARYNPEIARQSLEMARQTSNLTIEDVPDWAALERCLGEAEVVVTAGPAGVQILRHDFWAKHPTLRWLVDFNLTEPLGIEGIKPSDDLVERDGKIILGPLAIGGPKMKVHKACVAKLFERNDLVLNIEGVYVIARETV
ncbi:MAG: methylenetetrahydromethanopterin dehydrogenase [Acidobacteria bacterium]|nr:methylenetetrahydromethanopterin dehydrogenase [Acidobacteriota bacterium]MDW7983454.1 methylenetetrahydromethanopterin dehydrogenase [Acidobacteriota bacterium]